MDTVYHVLINALAADFYAHLDWPDATDADRVAAINRGARQVIDLVRQHGPPSKEQLAHIVKLFSMKGLPQTDAVGRINVAVTVARARRGGSNSELANSERISEAAVAVLSGIDQVADIALEHQTFYSSPQKPRLERQRRNEAVSVDVTLLDVHIEILMCLSDAKRAIIQSDIMHATRRGRTLVGKALKYLRDNDFVTRPHGERQGEAITERGEAILRSHGLARTRHA